jgi:hypothetical protein
VTGAVRLPRTIAGPVVLVVGPVVVGSALVVVSSDVVGSTVVVVVGAIVLGSTAVVVMLGCTAVVGAVMVGRVVVAPPVERARLVLVVRPTVAGAMVEARRAVVGGLVTASSPVSGVAAGGAAVVGSPGAVVVVVVVVGDADVGGGVAGRVGSAPPGACGEGVGWWGISMAEATRAARTAAVSPKTKNSSRQGRRGLARCRGDAVAMVHRPGSARACGV